MRCTLYLLFLFFIKLKTIYYAAVSVLLRLGGVGGRVCVWGGGGGGNIALLCNLLKLLGGCPLAVQIGDSFVLFCFWLWTNA